MRRAARPNAPERQELRERDINQDPQEKETAPERTAPGAVSHICNLPRKKAGRKTPQPSEGPAYFMVGFLRAKTVSTPPWVLKLPASPNAPSAPRPAVGSSAPIPAATPMPAQPPMPDSTATYCWPSGPL